MKNIFIIAALLLSVMTIAQTTSKSKKADSNEVNNSPTTTLTTESIYGEDKIDFDNLKLASSLLDASYENESSKPIYSQKCFSDADKIIGSELILFKKYKYSFVFHSTIVSNRQFTYHVDQEEKLDDDYYINYGNDIDFEFVGKNITTKYPTSDDVLEKLENLTEGGTYTALLQVTPVSFFKNGYSINKGSSHITVYVKILDIF